MGDSVSVAKMASGAGASALRFGAHLRELRIHLCQKSSASQGVREFIESSYVPLKKANPNFPILIRECSGIHPKLYARYAFGKENGVPLTNMSKDQVMKTLQTLVKQ